MALAPNTPANAGLAHDVDAAPRDAASLVERAAAEAGLSLPQPVFGGHPGDADGPGYGWARWPLGALEDAPATVAMLRSVLRPDPVAQAVPGVDLAVVPDDLHDGGRLLLILDVDSTLIQQEVIELLAAHAGREAEVAAVTDAAMRGELDFARSLHARVEALAGLPVRVITEVVEAVRLSPGAERLVAAMLADGHRVAAVSGGFDQVLTPLAERLGLSHHRANLLGVRDGALTGRVEGTVVDRAVKAASLREWAARDGVAPDHVIAVGDGANDADMLAAAGLSVAYNAKPALRRVADAQLNLPRLDAVGALAGLPGF
ncbi:phosphoserine phosphatase SerB [Tersicoccus phoenicis]|uniref:phosphoserine phosphatase n=1 Tax=Tersicoccus phoenicis TaxID=554083 RepID=A0A1R1LFS2_9MICC|nr:phosphoserine phosphatase SerB [Tersicoccus phoenicis]